LTNYGCNFCNVFKFIFYQRQNKYLTIENGFIKRIVHLKKINLTDIKQIKKFAGDYIIKKKTKLTINTQIIDPNSLAELKTN
jgi:hypothetical protein